MKIERLIAQTEWETVATTGTTLNAVQVYRLHDLNTVFEFTNEASQKNGIRYRVILPDTDWIKRTDIAHREPIITIEHF